MNKIFKKSLSIVATIVSACIMLSVPASAEILDKRDMINVNEVAVTTPVEPIEPAGDVTALNYVTAYNSFTCYYTSDFSQIQYNNNCAPTLAANVLSYFKTGRGRSNLYSGTITQTLYNQICSYVSYTPAGGGGFNNTATGITNFANNAGYSCYIDSYWLNLWSDVTRDIDANKPIMLNYNNHGYLILGYRTINGVNQLYVFTNWSTEPYKWLDFGSGMAMKSVYIY